MQEAAQARDAFREELAMDGLLALGAFAQEDLQLNQNACCNCVWGADTGPASPDRAPFTKNNAEQGDSEACLLCEKMELT
eukprot:793807-Amphidinium_carterae.5